MGYTADKEQLTNSDVTVCSRPFANSTTKSRPLLQHFVMEKIEYGPKPSGMNEGAGNVSVMVGPYVCWVCDTILPARKT